MKNKIELNEELICEEYVNTNIGVEKLSLKYHVGKKRIKEILDKKGISIKKRGGQNDKCEFIIQDHRVKKYINTEEYHYIVKDLSSDFVSKDIENKGGVLTNYIKEHYGVEIPTLYDRNKYYKQTGNYWWEQYLTYEKVANKEVKKCPYCNWTTVDIHNKSGMFETHLLKVHNITKLDYLNVHPEEREYFKLVNPVIDLQMETNTDKFVICKICGKKLSKIGTSHLKKHNITKDEYVLKYGDSDIMSKDTYEKFAGLAQKVNLVLSEKVKDRFTSKAEKEIMEYLSEFGVNSEKNRSLLNGQEIDIYIPDKKIAIEYNGNVWHTENFGKKDRNYHLNKMKLCNEKGVGLIQICDDEYIDNKELVLNKLTHIIGLDANKPKIFARKTEIRKIYKFQADEFLNKYHIQGKCNASLHLGCFYNDKLVAVMSFKNGSIKNNGWELVRFASDYHYVCCGVGGKLFKHFIRTENPSTVFSFADRRWTISPDNNLYTKMGFRLDKILRPDYKYYKSSG